MKGRRLLAAALALVVLAPGVAAGHPSQPSPARWTACEGKRLSDACEYSDEHHIYRGTCRQIRGALACVRNQPIEHR